MVLESSFSHSKCNILIIRGGQLEQSNAAARPYLMRQLDGRKSRNLLPILSIILIVCLNATTATATKPLSETVTSNDAETKSLFSTVLHGSDSSSFREKRQPELQSSDNEKVIANSSEAETRFTLQDINSSGSFAPIKATISSDRSDSNHTTLAKDQAESESFKRWNKLMVEAFEERANRSLYNLLQLSTSNGFNSKSEPKQSRRRFSFDGTVLPSGSIDDLKVKYKMNTSFQGLPEDGGIRLAIMYNDTSILAVRGTNKYYYWESAQTAAALIIFCMIVVGNLSILHRLKSCRRRRSNVNYFIVQLAIADLFVGLFSVTLDVILRRQKEFVYGLLACRASKYIAVLFVYSSAYLLVALSIDRWEAVVEPLAFTRNRGRGRILVAGAWLLALISATPVTIRTTIKDIEGLPQCWIDLDDVGWKLYMIYIFCSVLVLPALIIAICYAHIVYTIWQKGRLVAKQEQHHHYQQHKRQHQLTTSNSSSSSPTSSLSSLASSSSLKAVQRANVKSVVINVAGNECDESPYSEDEGEDPKKNSNNNNESKDSNNNTTLKINEIGPTVVEPANLTRDKLANNVVKGKGALKMNASALDPALDQRKGNTEEDDRKEGGSSDLTPGKPSKRRQHRKRKRLAKLKQSQHYSAQQHGSGVIPKARIKTVKMTLVIVAAYILCWSPFCIINLLSVFDLMTNNTNVSVALRTLSQSLAHLNSAVNPIIFWIFSSKQNNTSEAASSDALAQQSHQANNSNRPKTSSNAANKKGTIGTKREHLQNICLAFRRSICFRMLDCSGKGKATFRTDSRMFDSTGTSGARWISQTTNETLESRFTSHAPAN